MAVVTLEWIFTWTFLLRVFYEGQPKTCRRCNSPDHLAKDCKNTFCFNCDSIAHISKQCPSHRSPDPEPVVVSVENHSSADIETVTSDNDLSSVMDVQRQEDGDVPASISNVHDDDDADANNVNDMDDGDSCDEIVAHLHADYDESEEDPILGPRKRPREDDDSPDLFSKSPRPQDSGSLQSLQKSQVPPVSPSEAPT